MEGTLTAEWRQQNPQTEPAGKLLKRLLAARRRRWEEDQLRKFEEKGKSPPKNWKAKYKEPVSPDTADLPALPAAWCWATVAQCSSLIQYGSSAKTSGDVKGVPVLRMGNLTSGGRLVIEDLKCLPLDHEEFPNLLLENGDVLFNRTNSAELVGKTAVYSGSPPTCSFASYLIRVRMLEGVSSEFLTHALNGGLGRSWIKSVANQTVGQANVNGTKLAAFVLPLPPVALPDRSTRSPPPARDYRAQGKPRRPTDSGRAVLSVPDPRRTPNPVPRRRSAARRPHACMAMAGSPEPRRSRSTGLYPVHTGAPTPGLIAPTILSAPEPLSGAWSLGNQLT